MSNNFGFLVCTFIGLAVLAAVVIVGFRDGDAQGDAQVRIRVLRVDTGDGPGAGAPVGLHAEIAVDNRNDSPVMVSARLGKASVLAALVHDANSRRTAFAHSSRLDGVELLGAVEGRARRRFLLPVHVADASALRITATVDQVGRRTRIVSSTTRVSHAVDGALPVTPDLLRGR